MRELLLPKIKLRDLSAILGTAVFGVLVSGSYGIVHDQITYSIGPEYFTKFKFAQFHYADVGFGDRFFVACIGFLATWWVGLIAGWFIGRQHVPNQNRKVAYRKILLSFAVVLVSGMLAAAIAFVCGQSIDPENVSTAWKNLLDNIGVQDVQAFLTAAYIHNASYLGGAIGFILALFFIRKSPAKTIQQEPMK